ncbi:DUF1206 domain-containing protein [Allorhizobium taibaishanense]|uniref:DUF1206 domain-containing protein n=1 Tax=Allorhizobium taibaishanense TaxID=887144 RepID=A0A1Q9A9W7_9HYPH|nr:DUF1206 domain-containing protein [Allorhizobium taibaishanense]MBB4010068.1 hypothetical protein [Allorhizobium taibaishanense]OLP51673.1 hypothetical protein BJF91_16740 [Allorhizobium taibaishanense]
MPQGSKFELLARSGYVARGIVFLLVAGLALLSGVAGGKADTKSAVSELLQQPFGRIWVGLIGLGLLGFVAWRLAQSLADSDGHGRDKKAIAIRLALLGSAVTYIFLAFFALNQAFSGIRGSEGGGEKGVAQWVMSQPFGPYIAMAIGFGLIVGGVVTSAKGLTRKFERYLHLPDTKGILGMVCVYGLVARGFVFAITGVLFAYAGFTVDAEQAGGMSDALLSLRQLPFGAAIYIVVAAGLAAFGIYNLVEARYRIVRGPSVSDVKHSLSEKRI